MPTLSQNVKRLVALRVAEQTGTRLESFVDLLTRPAEFRQVVQDALSQVRRDIEIVRDAPITGGGTDEQIAGVILAEMDKRRRGMKRSNASGYDTHSFAKDTGRISKRD